VYTKLQFYSHTKNTMNGKIKKLTDKGFGFITPEDGSKDVFFHSNSLVGAQFNDLQEGNDVSFEIEQSPKGPNAVNVTLA
jgi:CspA family cold shock protein